MTFSDITQPTWKQIGEMQNEIDVLHQENGLKLKQILDLEELLLEVGKEFHRKGQWQDGHDYTFMECNHPICFKARKATEHLWKNPQEK